MDSESVDRLRRVIGRLAEQTLNASATSEGLTPTQASVLGVVAGRGPLTVGTIAEIEGLNPTMLSRVVGKLDDLALVQRTSDPADLRTVHVHVTAQGRKTHKRLKARRTAAVTTCLDELSRSQQTTLVAALPALEKLAAEMQAHPGAPHPGVH